MSSILDSVRAIAGSSLDFVMDTFTVTVDPQGTDTDYTCRGWVEDDQERYRERGLTIESGDAVIGLLQAQSATLTDISPNDHIEGPSDSNHRASKKGVIRDVLADPANATWMLSVRSFN